MEQKKLKRLSLDLPLEYTTEIKIRAAKKNISIKEWVFLAILEKITKENQKTQG